MATSLLLDPPTSQLAFKTAVVAATTIVAYLINKRHFAPLPGTSGPQPEFLIGNLRNVFIKYKDGWNIWKNVHHYGEFVILWIGPRRIVLIQDPNITAEIVRNRESYTSDPTFMDAVGSVLNYSMISLEGETWKRHRRALTPILSIDRLKFLLTQMENTVNLTVASIKERSRETNEPLNLKTDFENMAMDTMGYLAFGRAFRDIDGKSHGNSPQIDPCVLKEEVEVLSKEIGVRILGMGLYKYFGDSKRVRHAKNELSKVVRILLDEYQDNREKMDANKLEPTEWEKFMNRSFIAQVLSSSEGRDFTFEELRGEMVNFILVGSDTTSGTMAFAIKMLSEHPHVQEKLYEEIIAVIGKDAVPQYEQLQESAMPYLDKVVRETQRLSLGVPNILRTSTKEVVIHDVVFPKGTTFWLSLSQMHRNPKYWKDPLEFLPERWDRDGIANGGPINPKAFLPFGAGSRACFGMRLASLELRYFLVYLTRAFFFKELPPHLKDKVGEEKVVQNATVELVNAVALPEPRP